MRLHEAIALLTLMTSITLHLTTLVGGATTPSPPSLTSGVCGAHFDLTLVVDSSGSIRESNPLDGSYDNWNLTLMFVSRLMERLDISDSETGGVRVAAVTFSNAAKIEFFFHTDRDELRADILDTKYQDGNTNTSGGLRVMTREVFGKKDRTDFLGLGGTTDRRSVRDVALVITDGYSTWDNHSTIPDATAAKEDGDITLFVIGITKEIKEEEIRQMSSAPSTQNVTYWLLPDFTSLESVVKGITDQICLQVNRTDMTTTTIGSPVTEVLHTSTTTGNSPSSSTVPATDGPTGASVAPNSVQITDEALIISVAVLAALLFLLLLLLIILCCCCKTTPCCGAGLCVGGERDHCCASCCATEVFCCCGSMLCCFCCVQWLMCCCSCLCWTKHTHAKVSPTPSVVTIIPEFKNKGTNTSMISVKTPPPAILPPPPPPPPPPPEPKTIEVCGKCLKELSKCTCVREQYVFVPQPHPVVRPVYVPQPMPAPQPVPATLPCPVCYNLQFNNGGTTTCTQCSNSHHHCCGHDNSNNSYCEICETQRQRNHNMTTMTNTTHRHHHHHSHGNRSLLTPIDSSQIHLKGKKNKKRHENIVTSSDDDHHLTDRYAKAFDEAENGHHTGKVTGWHHDESHHEGSCSTRIFLVSDDQKSQHGSTAIGSPEEERSYVYLPTDCPVQMTRDMSETLKQDYMRVTAGK